MLCKWMMMKGTMQRLKIMCLNPNLKVHMNRKCHFTITTITRILKEIHFATTVEKMGMSCTHAKIQSLVMESSFIKMGTIRMKKCVI